MPKNTKDLPNKKAVSQNLIDDNIKIVNKTKSRKKATPVPDKTVSAKNKTNITPRKGTAKKVSTSKRITTRKTSSSNVKKNTKSKRTSVSDAKNNIKNKKISSSIIRKSSSSTPKSKKIEIIEYYDLPYRYNQTVVKILAQTPNTLFVYWDISDIDKKKYIEEFGESFFDTTIPVLIIHNKTINYSFEIEINDFANSWYFNVDDTKCNYEIELGRKAKANAISLPNNYIRVAYSNIVEAPNNHILFEKNQKALFFKNLKNNTRYTKDFSQFEFKKYIGKIYNIYDIYKKFYHAEELKDLHKNSSSSF